MKVAKFTAYLFVALFAASLLGVLVCSLLFIFTANIYYIALGGGLCFPCFIGGMLAVIMEDEFNLNLF